MTNLDLYSSQNPDGGWPFRSRISCTEPTVLAALALAVSGGPKERYLRAIEWLRSVQRSDGGWPPMAGVAQSTWVTSLVLLLPSEHLGERQYRRGVDWLLGLQGEETSFYFRLRQRLQGRSTPREEMHSGWPFFPGTAAWVSPTATAILALRKNRHVAAAPRRIAEGQLFLLDRMCADGGWNHGSVRPLGIESESYPETTGLALLALQGLPPEQLRLSREAALRHFKTCHSAEASAWLRLALEAHGVPVPATSDMRTRDTRDTALRVLSETASGRRMLLL